MDMCNSFDRKQYSESINVCNSGEWVLVFEDQFNKHQLSSIWQDSRNRQGALYGNNGKAQEYNTLDNIEISNGSLKIIADRKTSPVQKRAYHLKNDYEILEDGLMNLRDYYYFSAFLRTKVNFDYGLLEAEVKIPKGKGFWPAFWLYDEYKIDEENTVYNELDVFEFWNETNYWGNYDPLLLSKVHVMTSHYRSATDMCSLDYEGCDFSDSFHKFSVRWEPNVIEWYVDDILKRRDVRYYTLLGQESGCVLNANTEYQERRIFPQNPMHIIFNLAIQHSIDTTWLFNNQNWLITGIIDNNPDEYTPFPSQMEVQWVRYYQRYPRQDVRIENPTQHQLSQNLYNVIAGENVLIDCEFFVQDEEFLTILANHTTTIGPGFHALPGSCVRISPYAETLDENVYQQGENVEIDNRNYKQTTIESDKEYDEEICDIEDISDSSTNNMRINVYPNPSNGCFYLEIENSTDDCFEMTLENVLGTHVLSKSITATKPNRIEIFYNTPGVYYVCLTSKHTGLCLKKKLIII